ncbi:MAG: class I SAM-dependent methyltransferase [Anaerolineae bacterium]
MDDITDIERLYSGDPEREDSRLERHQLEYDLTWRYLERYLPSSGDILEIGAATGRYTIELARRGYAVTAVDLSAVELDLCRQHLATEGLADLVRLEVADARDLASFPAAAYDAVLLMGPLYHLVLEPDRGRALAQVCARLRPGGILVSAFISRYGIMGDLLRNVPHWIVDRDEVRAILDLGRDPEHYAPGQFRGYFSTVEEILPLHEAQGFQTLALAAVEPAISADDESYNRLEGEQRRLWLDLLEEISTEPSSIGASRHLLYVGKRPAE